MQAFGFPPLCIHDRVKQVGCVIFLLILFPCPDNDRICENYRNQAKGGTILAKDINTYRSRDKTTTSVGEWQISNG